MTPGARAIAARDSGRAFRILALAAAAFTFVVIVASAFVRHSQTDARCLEWPACAARSAESTRQAAAVTTARITHRMAATIAALLVVGMVAVARARTAQRRVALAALALVAALAAFGAATAESRSPLVAFGNLAGGYALFTLLMAAHAAATPGAAAPPAARTAAAAALLFVYAQVAQVTLTGSSLALLALLHRGIAVGCAVLVLATAWSLREQYVLATGLVAALVVLAAAWVSGASLAAAVLHNAAAAALAGMLGHVAARATAAPRPSGSGNR